MDLVELPAAAIAVRHPWEQVRAAFFLRLLRDRGLPVPGSRVLDAGSGDGWFAGRLADASGARILCWDRAYADRPPAAAAAGISFTGEEPDGTFDLVLALDVAEHVEDDEAFLARIVGARLAAGGHLLFSVPAWPALFSAHDRRLHHHRRYTPRSARALLEAAGASVVVAGGLFHSLVLPRAAQVSLGRTGESESSPAGAWRGSAVLTRAIATVLTADAWASRMFARIGWDVPGLSWWALCRKA